MLLLIYFTGIIATLILGKILNTQTLQKLDILDTLAFSIFSWIGFLSVATAAFINSDFYKKLNDYWEYDKWEK